jgi:DNA modification methylase
MNYQLHHGDCLEVLKTMADNSVDSIVTDPPYGLSFMGKKWDYDVPSEDVWRECLRVLKPGGHLLAFAGTRTQHRMAVRIEDAGFEIRDMIAWVYSTGFPKSLDVSKAIDKAAGAEREVIGKVAGMGKQNPEWNGTAQGRTENSFRPEYDATSPATPEAQQWAGWGTALKPALEPITVARKPLGEKTVAANVLEHGTGAINVDGCRVNPGEDVPGGGGLKGGASSRHEGWQRAAHLTNEPTLPHTQGRWPANLIHDGSDEVVGLFPQTGASKATPRNNGDFKSVAKGRDLPHVTYGHDDNGGSAARFFYCAKASKKDRDEGCEGLPVVTHQSGMGGAMPTDDDGNARDRFKAESRNHHPTVKPTDLMRYLCRLVTQPGGVVLDPFMGSGSTGKAAMLEGFRFIGIEREAEYLQIAKARIEREPAQKQLL